MTVSHGKPYAGNLHVRFDEGAGVPDEGRLALLLPRLVGEMKKSRDGIDVAAVL